MFSIYLVTPTLSSLFGHRFVIFGFRAATRAFMPEEALYPSISGLSGWTERAIVLMPH